MGLLLEPRTKVEALSNCGRLQKELFCAVFICYFPLGEQLKVRKGCLISGRSGFALASRWPFHFSIAFVSKSLLTIHLTLRLIRRFWAKKPYVDPKRIGIWGWVSVFFNYLHPVSISNWDVVVYFNLFFTTLPRTFPTGSLVCITYIEPCSNGLSPGPLGDPFVARQGYFCFFLCA